MITKLFAQSKSILFDLEYEYGWTIEQNFDNCPIKVCMPISSRPSGIGETPELHRYQNYMFGQLSNGLCGSKIIYVDEDLGFIDARVDLFGSTLLKFSDPALTYFRCGMMAALCIHFRYGIHNLRNLRVGFIGMGKINRMTKKVLVSLGLSENTPFLTNNCPVDASEYQHLQTCDVVIACTNNFDLDRVYRRSDFNGLVITQDGEWTINTKGEGRIKRFADHPEQLLTYWQDEFPAHTNPPVLSNLLELQKTTPWILPTVTLHGLAIADLVVAKYL